MIFGTDGIRARVGEAPLDQATIEKLSRVLREHLASDAVIVLGSDTRSSCLDLRTWISSRLGDLLIHDLGVVPTPVVAFETFARQADLGIMITASHNPAEDNGLKFFNREGLKLDYDTAMAWSDRVEAMSDAGPAEPATFETCAPDHYRAFIHSHFKPADFKGLRLAFDLAQGAGYALVPQILRELSLISSFLGVEPDGANINRDCGALHPQQLADLVRTSGASLGFALDGDGDRLVVTTSEPVHGDIVLYAMLMAMGAEGKQPTTLVGTIMCGMGLEKALADRGVTLERTPVGDQHVLAEMITKGHLLGGEPSGHLIQSDLFPAGDGFLAALRLARALARDPNLIEAARAAVPQYPVYEKAHPVRHKPPLSSVPEVSSALAALERRVAGQGRLIVRYSGTENKLRVYVEGPSLEPFQAEIAALDDAIQGALS